METGVTTGRLAGFEASFKRIGVVYEQAQETIPSGQVNTITKKSFEAYGIKFERTSNSDGSWSNDLKFNASFFQSFFFGIKAEGSISLVKESYKPNK